MNGDYILLNDGSILNLNNIVHIFKSTKSNVTFKEHYPIICYDGNDYSATEVFKSEDERDKRFDSIIKTFTLTLRK